MVPRFDFKGFLLSGAGLLGLISGLSLIGRGMAPGWEVAAQIVVSLVLLALYVRHAGGNEDAILDLRLLRIPTFFAGVAGGLLFRDRHRRPALPPAAALADRLRPDAVRVRLDDLRHRRSARWR